MQDANGRNGAWVDFRALRERLDFLAVLRHYGVEGKVRGERFQCFCPLPTHAGRRRSPSFSAHLPKKVFRCFGGGCGAQGNVLDFACRMEGLDPARGEDLRKAALLVQQKFGVQGTEPAKSAVVTKRPTGQKATAQENVGQAGTCPTLVNAPLDFELRGLDASHPYLKERGFTPETIAHFGLGYCGRGLMQGRIAIPLHDRRARLVGYAGRLIDDAKVGEEHPKYLFPGTREREGKVYAFHKSLFLYNGFRQTAPLSDLIVVEGFASVWWLWQSGFPNVAALMGWSCSDRQAALIVRAVNPGGRVWVFPDGDDGGRRCAEGVLPKVAPHRFVHWVKLGQGEQPTDLKPDDLRDLLKVAGDAKGGTNGRP